MALKHLIYLSTAVKEFNPDILDKIMNSAVQHNTPNAVTGMLLYSQGTFLQVLEGEADAVDETYARVEKDPRHRGIIVLVDEPIATRSFDQWSMGFKRIGPEDVDANPAYAPLIQGGFDAERIGAQPGIALELLKDFSRNSA